MSLCKYCKDQGMTLEQYRNFEQNLESTAQAIKSQLHYNGGMYYPIAEILPHNTNEDIESFLIQELKKLGIEFFDNDTLYRVTE